MVKAPRVVVTRSPFVITGIMEILASVQLDPSSAVDALLVGVTDRDLNPRILASDVATGSIDGRGQV